MALKRGFFNFKNHATSMFMPKVDDGEVVVSSGMTFRSSFMKTVNITKIKSIFPT
jgi:hypothetical protein